MRFIVWPILHKKSDKRDFQHKKMLKIARFVLIFHFTLILLHI